MSTGKTEVAAAQKPTTSQRRVLCLTPDDCFAAGWEDGASDQMPAALVDRMVALHRPYLLPAASDRAA